MPRDYPVWQYYPTSAQAPPWVAEFIEVVRTAVARTAEPSISSQVVESLNSDRVLTHLAPGLIALGYKVERSKTAADRIRRPVLFGENGKQRVAYEVDAVQDEHGIVVEVEAGRGARGNAAYRDLIRASLIVGAKYLVLGVMLEYRHQSGGKTQYVKSYDDTRAQIEAVYASGRLNLPFDGLLLFGY